MTIKIRATSPPDTSIGLGFNLKENSKNNQLFMVLPLVVMVMMLVIVIVMAVIVVVVIVGHFHYLHVHDILIYTLLNLKSSCVEVAYYHIND